MMSPSAALLAAWLCASALILKVQSGPLTEAELDSVLLRFRKVSPAAFAPGQRSLISTKTQPISAARDGIAGLSWGQGTHVLEVRFGPDGTQPKYLIADTGSDLMAVDCKDLCADSRCGVRHADPPLDLAQTRGVLVSCEENEKRGFRPCVECHSIGLPLYGAGNGNKSEDLCVFGAKYVEGSYWHALKVRDSVSLGGVSSEAFFGCIYEEAGEFQKQPADGIIGLSRAADTLPAQLFQEKKIPENAFGICLNGEGGGALTLGRYHTEWNKGNLQKLKVMDAANSYWTVITREVLIGGQRMYDDYSVLNQDKGTILDSGTTYVILPSAGQAAFDRAIKATNRSLPLPSSIGFSPFSCSDDDVAALPSFSFVLEGTDGASVFLPFPPQKYVMRSKEDSSCYYTVFFSDAVKGTILGQNFMQGTNFYFDRERNEVRAAEASCPPAPSLQLALRRGKDNKEQQAPKSVMVVAPPSSSAMIAKEGDLASSEESLSPSSHPSSPFSGWWALVPVVVVGGLLIAVVAVYRRRKRATGEEAEEEDDVLLGFDGNYASF